MISILKYLNPFNINKPKIIYTSWGNIQPAVDVFPVVYLLFIYGFIYIFPYGRDVVGMSWFDWFRSEDGPLEWIQFIGYFLGFVCSSLILFKRRRIGINKRWIAWLILALICFFVAGEEISWGERITGIGIDSIRAINSQGETSIHNIHFFHHYLLDPSFEISCLFLGWIGWRAWPSIDAFPPKRYSLYFLFVALFYFYFDISQASTISQIRNDQEIFEVLMSLGLASHCWNKVFQKSQTETKNQYLL